MFITLTFVDSAARKFWDRTVNASQIRSFKAHSYFNADLQTHPEGTQITWIDSETGANVSIVTAKASQIAAALGAVDLTS